MVHSLTFTVSINNYIVPNFLLIQWKMVIINLNYDGSVTHIVQKRAEEGRGLQRFRTQKPFQRTKPRLVGRISNITVTYRAASSTSSYCS
jgi:hypothetical protein